MASITTAMPAIDLWRIDWLLRLASLCSLLRDPRQQIMQRVVGQRSALVRQMLAQFFVQPRSIPETMLDPGADKHQIFAVELGAQQSFLCRGVVYDDRFPNDLIRGIHRLFRQFPGERARAWWLCVNVLGKCRGVATEERQVPSRRSSAIQANGRASRRLSVGPFPAPETSRRL